MTEQIKDIESALKKVKDQKENFGFMDRFTVDENWEVTKALEKQIPIVPINKTKSDNGVAQHYENCNIIICPSCERRLKLKSKGNYCDKCGQRIDWGNEE